MTVCRWCDSPCEAMTPLGDVCRSHAIEYYTGLVATGTRLALRWRLDHPDWPEQQAEVARVNAEWTARQRDLLPLQTLERELLVTALEESYWVQKRAAERLGISYRVMKYKVAKHRIDTHRKGRQAVH